MLQMFIYADLNEGDQGPIGRFEWKHSSDDDTLVTDYIEIAKKQGNLWPPIQARLFGSDTNRFAEICEPVLARLNKISWW